MYFVFDKEAASTYLANRGAQCPPKRSPNPSTLLEVKRRKKVGGATWMQPFHLGVYARIPRNFMRFLCAHYMQAKKLILN